MLPAIVVSGNRTREAEQRQAGRRCSGGRSGGAQFGFDGRFELIERGSNRLEDAFAR